MSNCRKTARHNHWEELTPAAFRSVAEAVLQLNHRRRRAFVTCWRIPSNEMLTSQQYLAKTNEVPAPKDCLHMPAIRSKSRFRYLTLTLIGRLSSGWTGELMIGSIDGNGILTPVTVSSVFRATSWAKAGSIEDTTVGTWTSNLQPTKAMVLCRVRTAVPFLALANVRRKIEGQICNAWRRLSNASNQ